MDDVLQGDAGQETELARAGRLFPYFGASLWQKALQMPYGFVPIPHEKPRTRMAHAALDPCRGQDAIEVVSLCFMFTAIDRSRLTILRCM